MAEDKNNKVKTTQEANALWESRVQEAKKEGKNKEVMAQETKDRAEQKKEAETKAREAEDKTRKWQKELEKEEARNEHLEKQLTEAVKKARQWQKVHEKCEAELKKAKNISKNSGKGARGPKAEGWANLFANSK